MVLVMYDNGECYEDWSTYPFGVFENKELAIKAICKYEGTDQYKKDFLGSIWFKKEYNCENGYIFTELEINKPVGNFSDLK